MFAFLGQTVTPDNTAESVGIFVSFGLIAQAISYAVLQALTKDFLMVFSPTFCSFVIIIGLMMSLSLPTELGRENDQP
jgi:hypothetical protein